MNQMKLSLDDLKKSAFCFPEIMRQINLFLLEKNVILVILYYLEITALKKQEWLAH